MSTSRTELSRFTAIFASGTLVSRLFGLVRDVLMASLIPAPAREVFLFAFRFPNMLRDMLGEGAVNAAFVPIMTEAHEKESAERFKQLVRACFTVMLLVFTGITLAGILLAGFLEPVVIAAGRFSAAAPPTPEKIAHTIAVVRWTLPYFVLIGAMAFLMAPLYVLRHYSTPAWTPALFNVAIIGSMVYWWIGRSSTDPVWVLVAGIWAGGAAQFAMMYFAVSRRLGPLGLTRQLNDPGVRRACWLLGPVILGQATGEVNKLVDGFFAYSLQEVSTLFYANRLIQLPLSVFALAIGVAVLPAISRAHVANDADAMRDTLKNGFRQCIFLVTPAMAGLLALNEPIVRLLFERGEFTPEHTAKTATALLYYGAGLLIFGLIRVGVQGFYAVQNTRTPVMLASASMALNIGLNVVLVGPLGYRGLALATTLSYAVNLILLYLFLWRRFGTLWDRSFAATLAIVGLASAAMAGFAYGLHAVLAAFLHTDQWLQQAISVLFPVGGAVLAYLALCQWMGLPEWAHFRRTLFRR